ncbi:VOC family protein [Shewanella sp. GD03713]|uniref:VOC family protein n=1 Tax=Shewanella sp. GD03713 TaxID=2975372 RepID=UPI000B343E99|nr:VOC family protein [Shewanella sp. GD03713]MDH1470995.1 VOC family protein [Shewanella sp. GD03713]QXN26359.1 VOC family protein [Shewanella putrefaciens]
MLSIAPLVWGEIPVSDMDRAIAFYQQHFGVEFKRDDMEDMQYATLVTEEEGAASIGLVKYSMSKPSMEGSTVYLHFSAQLQPLVDKLVAANVTMLLPVTPIKDGGCGYIALFVDSEGNKVGLWSQNQ